MQDYVVIDLEMTGLNAKTDHILEVGAVRVRNHQAVDKFGAILCQNVKIPEKVTELTGITEAMVQGGMEKEEAMRQFFEFIGEDIIVGQNVIFDYGFLKQWAVNHNMPLERNAVDTLKLARKFLPKEQKKDLETIDKLLRRLEADPQTDQGKRDAFMKDYQELLSDSFGREIGDTHAAALDRSFTKTLILHCRLAVDLSELALDYSGDGEVKDLAEEMIEQHTAQVDKLQALLQSLDD